MDLEGTIKFLLEIPESCGGAKLDFFPKFLAVALADTKTSQLLVGRLYKQKPELEMSSRPSASTPNRTAPQTAVPSAKAHKS
jgi:hypothetical protein